MTKAKAFLIQFFAIWAVVHIIIALIHVTVSVKPLAEESRATRERAEQLWQECQEIEVTI